MFGKLAIFGGIGVLGFAISASAANTPFLSVDLNGNDGPTASGYQGWNFATTAGTVGTPVSQTFGTTTVAITAAGTNFASTDRGSGPGDMMEDFVYTGRDTAGGMGRNYLEFDFSGLSANTPYAFTFYSYDPNSGTNVDSYMAWGVDNPATWQDNNTGPGSSYQPAPGGANDIIPHLARTVAGGPWPTDPTGDPDGIAAYASNFTATTDASGNVSIFGWNDANSYSTQTASLVNGFTVAAAPVPEPASLALLALGGLALLVRRRRRVA